MKQLIEEKNYQGIKELLSRQPHLANEGITIPFDDKCKIKAHPLHRICDAVFAKKITDEEAVELAKIFLEAGADINGAELKQNEDIPLLHADSLHAEQLGIFYIEQGADIYYKGRQDGATALHWAAYCGRDQLVERLIRAGAIIDIADTAHNSTPLGWAVHSLMTSDRPNTLHQAACIKLLLQAGADEKK